LAMHLRCDLGKRVGDEALMDAVNKHGEESRE
jgi:hypothetical protein